MRWAAVPALIAVLGACEGAETREIVRDSGTGRGGTPVFKDEYKKQSLFGEEGLTFGGKKKKKPSAGEGGGGIGVNSFLWRATLDTISFMPVSSADPFGGVVITDWHSQSEAPSERFKLNVYIIGRALRADGVRVAVFRQVNRGSGQWTDAAVEKGVDTKIEDAILTRARQLRHETLQE